MTLIVIAISLLAVFAVGFVVGLSAGANLERRLIVRYYTSKFGDATSRSLLAFMAHIVKRRHYINQLENRWPKN